jgi:hypothetical protein
MHRRCVTAAHAVHQPPWAEPQGRFRRRQLAIAVGTALGSSPSMTDLLEIIAAPVFAVIDFALAAPASAAVVVSVAVVGAFVAIL